MNFPRFKLKKAVVPLGGGRILIAGGAAQPEIYDIASNSFRSGRRKPARQLSLLDRDAAFEWRGFDRGWLRPTWWARGQPCLALSTVGLPDCLTYQFLPLKSVWG